MARKNLPLPEEKYFKDAETTAGTILRFIIDVNELAELGPEEAAAKIGELTFYKLFPAQRLVDAKDAIDDLGDAVEYAREYVACAREASLPDADLLRLDTNLDSLAEQAAQYARMSQGDLPPPPVEAAPVVPPAVPVAPTSPSTAEQISQAFKALIVVATILGLLAIFVYSREHRSNSPAGSGGASTYSMYWSCPPGADQCVQTFGAASGIAESGLTSSACTALQQQWASEGRMQPGSSSSGGTWCAP
jgi:hypothetical protein